MGVQGIEGNAWTKKRFRFWERTKHFVRSFVGFVFATTFSFAIEGQGRKATGAMEVEVGDEDVLVEGVDGLSLSLFDVAISHVLADDAAIFPFDQSIVVGSSGSRFGLFDKELVEELGDNGVDKLATIVGMKPFKDERK